MTPAALSLIMTTYSGAQRRKGLALWGAVGSLGVAAGVLFGGALTTWAGWQIIFWVNVPIGAVALAVALKVLPQEPDAAGRPAASSTCPARSPSSAGSMTLMYALGATTTARLAVGATPWSRSPCPRRCWPRSSASSGAPPRRWSRRTPGRSARWCPARPSCSASPACSSAPSS